VIDNELYRLQHKQEFEETFNEHNAAVLEKSLPDGVDFGDDDFVEPVLHKQAVRDKKLAKNDPQMYCADRCVATGNCDVFEDMFDLSPMDVMKFCEECVLSEDEEPCDVPDKFLEEFNPYDLKP